ncbi:hypothetical protein Ahy_A02g005023 isoform E [Arachis hypogaea]|uniref:Uncharacterized protein n=2 Tax=Arachis hypogaea TaxID=3818 RepID=A0A445E5J3_ARAHY|nr:hypothetical protein Ahy_A02g005023 isoform E [Arachis hypogaea]
MCWLLMTASYMGSLLKEYCEPLLAKIQQTMIRLKIQPTMIASAPLASKVFSAFKQMFHGGVVQEFQRHHSQAQFAEALYGDLTWYKILIITWINADFRELFDTVQTNSLSTRILKVCLWKERIFMIDESSCVFFFSAVKYFFWKSVVAEWCATLEEEKIRRSPCRQWWNDATTEGSTQTSFCGLKSLPESIIRMSFHQFPL